VIIIANPVESEKEKTDTAKQPPSPPKVVPTPSSPPPAPPAAKLPCEFCRRILDSAENLEKHKKVEHKADLKKLQALHTLSDSIVSTIGAGSSSSFVKPKRFKIFVPTKKILKTALYLRDDVGYDSVESVSGVDWPNDNQFEVVYHLTSYSSKELEDTVLALSTKVPRDNPKTPSLESVWKSSEFHERETHEMFGIIFKDHPRLDRLLLPEDWCDIPPLRKDFNLPRRTR